MKQAKRQLAGSGEALPAGAIGQELIYSVSNANYPLGSGAEAAITGASLTLTEGVWEVSVLFTLVKDTATFSGTDLLINIAATGVGQSIINGAFRAYGGQFPTTFGSYPCVIPPVRIRRTASATIFPDNNSSASASIYINAYLATFTGTPKYNLVFRAVRVA